MSEKTTKIKTREFYVKFEGRIMVIAENWNDAENEAKKLFPTLGILKTKIKNIEIKE